MRAKEVSDQHLSGVLSALNAFSKPFGLFKLPTSLNLAWIMQPRSNYDPCFFPLEQRGYLPEHSDGRRSGALGGVTAGHQQSGTPDGCPLLVQSKKAINGELQLCGNAKVVHR